MGMGLARRTFRLLTVIIALGANALIAVLKSIVAVFTGSASMVAEAAHSWADTGNEIFLMIAERRSARKPDERHPFGYGREAYLWSMLAAFGLFAVGSAVSIAHGIQSLGQTDDTDNYVWAYAVLGVSFVLEGISFFRARGEARKAARDLEVTPKDFLMARRTPLCAPSMPRTRQPSLASFSLPVVLRCTRSLAMPSSTPSDPFSSESCWASLPFG